LFQGWDVGALQNAITGCDNNTPGTAAGDAAQCPYFTVRPLDCFACIGLNQGSHCFRSSLPTPLPSVPSRHTPMRTLVAPVLSCLDATRCSVSILMAGREHTDVNASQSALVRPRSTTTRTARPKHLLELDPIFLCTCAVVLN